MRFVVTTGIAVRAPKPTVHQRQDWRWCSVFLTLVRESQAHRRAIAFVFPVFKHAVFEHTVCLNISYILISSSQRPFKYLLYKEVFQIMAVFFIYSFSTCKLKNYCDSDIILGSSQNSNIPVIRDSMKTQRENVGLLVSNLCHCINSSLTHSCPHTVSQIVTVQLDFIKIQSPWAKSHKLYTYSFLSIFSN